MTLQGPRREHSTWFKTRHTEPFIVEVQVFKCNAKYIWPETTPGSQTMRRLRIDSESCYFKTRDEADRHVQQQQRKTNDNRGANRPSRY